MAKTAQEPGAKSVDRSVPKGGQSVPAASGAAGAAMSSSSATEVHKVSETTFADLRESTETISAHLRHTSAALRESLSRLEFSRHNGASGTPPSRDAGGLLQGEPCILTSAERAAVWRTSVPLPEISADNKQTGATSDSAYPAGYGVTADHQQHLVWRWYLHVVEGYALRCASLFPCSSKSCAASSHLIHVPPARDCAKGGKSKCEGVKGGKGGPGGKGRQVRRGEKDGELVKATARCIQCGLYVCGECTWKARRIVGFHAPLPCEHRVAVEACVTRVQSAMDDLDRKRAAVAAPGVRSRSARERVPRSQGPAGEGSVSVQERREDAQKPLPTCIPTLSEIILLLQQLGRTSEVAALREIEAGTYAPPAQPSESSAELISRSSKPCPTGCGWDITKDKGCNHMTCKKCGACV